MVAGKIAEGDWVGVIMMGAIARLMGLARVEGDALVYPGITIPIAASIGFRRAVPIKGVSRIEHGHSIHEIADWTQPREALCRGNGRAPWNPIKRRGVFRPIWK